MKNPKNKKAPTTESKSKTTSPDAEPRSLVHPEGFEPTTFCSEDRRSNPLSYGCTYPYYNIFHKISQKLRQLPRRLSRQLFSHSLHQSWGVVMLAVGIIVGTILGVVFRINYFASPVWILFVAAVSILMYLKPKFFIVGLCLIAGMILAFFRVAAELSAEDYIRQFHGLNITVAGVIDGDPETDDGVTKLKIKNLNFGDLGNELGDEHLGGHATSGSLYISLSKNEALKRSDTITLSGKLSEGFGTYSGYMYRPKVIKILKPDPGNLVVTIRDWFAERIKSIVPDPEVSLGLSYLLGMKTGLDDELNENLRTVGLVHIVVASGAHLSILVEIARKIFGRLSRFSGLLFSILFILFFMCMVGWTPSILRAGVMAILTLLSWYVGRKIAPLRLIILVAAFTLMLDPMFLLNLGWLLSFASYAGIMLLMPSITKFFYGQKKPGFVASTVLTTLAATLMTLPVILYCYGQVSLISVAANLLILPTLSYAMGVTFLAGVFAGVPGVSVAVGFVATKLLDFHIAVVGWFGAMEQFLIKIDAYNPWIFLIYIPIIILMLAGFTRRKFLMKRRE